MSVLDTALQYQGTPYVWGGSSPQTGFDCSGLVQYSFSQNGITVPRTSQKQYKYTAGNRINNTADLQSGDLVFFATDGTGNASHVGIYMGNNQFLHAPSSGDVVKVSSLASGYYAGKFIGGGRVAGGGGSVVAVADTDSALSLVGKIVAAVVVVLLGVLAVVFFAKAFDTKVPEVPKIDLKKKANDSIEKKAKKEVEKSNQETKSEEPEEKPLSDELQEIMASIDEDIDAIKNMLKE